MLGKKVGFHWIILCLCIVVLSNPTIGVGQSVCDETTANWEKLPLNGDSYQDIIVKHHLHYISHDSVLLRSTDCAVSWDTVKVSESQIRDIAFNPVHSDTMFVLTEKSISMTPDKGETFKKIGTKLELSSSSALQEIKVFPTIPNILNLITSDGEESNIYQSRDYGDTWTISTPENSNDTSYTIHVPLAFTDIDTMILSGTSSSEMNLWKMGAADKNWVSITFGDRIQRIDHIKFLKYPENRLILSDSDSLYYTDNYLRSVNVIRAIPDTIGGIKFSQHILDPSLGNYLYIIGDNDKAYEVNVGSWDLRYFSKGLPPSAEIKSLVLNHGGDPRLYVVTKNNGIYYWNISTGNYSPNDKSLPTSIELEQNYPNPFNPSTNIRFSLPQSERVIINIYNSIGQKIETLINRQMSAGSHSITFDASGPTPSGVYIYRLKANGLSQSKKMLLLK